MFINILKRGKFLMKFIRKSVLMLVCAIFLLLLIGSVQAEELNDTSVMAKVDGIDIETVDVDSTI